jgi:protein-S-isoprenylcysteine O-methyltransferase Ste14
MYSTSDMILAGLAIALGFDWMLVLVVPAVLILHFGVVKREERYLEAKFGESYRAYVGESAALLVLSGGTIQKISIGNQ